MAKESKLKCNLIVDVNISFVVPANKVIEIKKKNTIICDKTRLINMNLYQKSNVFFDVDNIICKVSVEYFVEKTTEIMQNIIVIKNAELFRKGNWYLISKLSKYEIAMQTKINFKGGFIKNINSLNMQILGSA